MASSPVREFLVTYFMPDKCYEELFVRLHFHAPCVRLVLTKAAGFWMLLDVLLAQLPQLLKILWSGSAEGLSLVSVIMQLYALSCPVVYAMANHFPLFAWAERILTLAQTLVIVFLILRYRGDTLKGLLFVLAYTCVMFLLGSYAAAKVILAMHSSSVAALIASKALQAGTNYCNGHTGQLSSLSVFLTWAGSLGATFTSVQVSASRITHTAALMYSLH
ncbi:mannose-P-dolichol utilization defect 1 protein-like [Betta splendens]|uniref:Mannose-P-dolichol utilization defect 1 protein-like n=1 Tax=Betta splendens TaxID=158456 RepID=A0A6P7PP31_BETSP|nr:mannose-P-dolichol utilization defect 1 protein-like [Betta splendens]